MNVYIGKKVVYPKKNCPADEDNSVYLKEN